jgi:hypothetical protein
VRDLAAIRIYIADSACRGCSPLYDRICRTVAESDAVLDLVEVAPPEVGRSTCASRCSRTPPSSETECRVLR